MGRTLCRSSSVQLGQHTCSCQSGPACCRRSKQCSWQERLRDQQLQPPLQQHAHWFFSHISCCFTTPTPFPRHHPETLQQQYTQYVLSGLSAAPDPLLYTRQPILTDLLEKPISARQPEWAGRSGVGAAPVVQHLPGVVVGGMGRGRSYQVPSAAADGAQHVHSIGVKTAGPLVGRVVNIRL